MMFLHDLFPDLVQHVGIIEYHQVAGKYVGHVAGDAVCNLLLNGGNLQLGRFQCFGETFEFIRDLILAYEIFGDEDLGPMIHVRLPDSDPR